jgi:hypothetical protein
MSQPRIPDFSDQQLAEIVRLAMREQEVTAFIGRMDGRCQPQIGQNALVAGIAYTAAERLDFITKFRAEKAQKMKEAEEAARLAPKATEPPPAPRIPASEIPALQEPTGCGNGHAEPKGE